MNYSGSYLPKYTPLEERSFLTYLDDKKYQRFMKNPDKFLKNTKIINFDIIHISLEETYWKNQLNTIKQCLKIIVAML